MLRPAFFLLLAVALQGANAQQVESHGPPASILSPSSPGTGHATPSSVNSPTPAGAPGQRVFFSNARRLKPFGDPRRRRPRHEFVPVPIFIPAYPLASDSVDSEQTADPAAPEDTGEDSSSNPDSQALRDAYNRGARDALAQQRDALAQKRDSRYGEHYLDGREQSPSKPSASKGKPAKEAKEAEEADGTETAPENAKAAAVDQPDDSPATVFIFKDGHKIQTQNYAIVGETLFDFSNNAMKKFKLAELDLDATKKANDDLGITVKFPSTL
ncbi:MAG TPA: hypothetical protein VI685_12575 [Candidatus Angelobacter sp.]